MTASKAKKLTNDDLKKQKTEMRNKYHLNHINILTSEYFEYFDENNPKHMHCKQSYYLSVAAQIAMNSLMNHKHGAIIVHKKNVIAAACNYYYGKHSIHAEVAAINQLKGRFKFILPECELYVARIGPDRYDNALKYSKPCNNCQNYITKKSIRTTYYSTNYEYDDKVSMIIKSAKLLE
jgi:deoxycytidylate deaminase